MGTYSVTLIYKYSDVVEGIEANSKEEAIKIAEAMEDIEPVFDCYYDAAAQED